MPRGGTLISPREKRMSEVYVFLQDELDLPYIQANHQGIDNEHFKFAIGDPVVSYDHSLWYEGKVNSYEGVMIPRSIYRDPNMVVPWDKQMPTYEVQANGWPKSSCKNFPENELILQYTGEYVDVFGMLYAHEWNVWKMDVMGRTKKDLGNGVWFIPSDQYEIVEGIWKAFTGETISFRQFCGGVPAK